MSTIEVTGLSLAFDGRAVLTELDLHVRAGTVAAVLGRSGCGKTTLLRAIAGLVRPQAGMIRFGEDVVAGPGTWVRPEARNVGVVPQEGALFPHLDVTGNVAFGLRGSRAAKAERVGQLLELVGMSGTETMHPHELSGGMQQRVAVARALSRRPSVVLLDEPFSALDTSLRDDVRRDVFHAIRQDHATAILVTHDQDEALGFADHVAVMRDGRIVQAGSPDDVYQRPVDIAAARFVGEAVELAATVVSNTGGTLEVATKAGAIPARTAQPVTVGDRGTVVFRPEQLQLLGEAGAGTATGRPLGPGRVLSVRYHGHDCLIRLELPGGDQIRVRQLGRSVAQPGDRVEVSASGSALFFPE